MLGMAALDAGQVAIVGVLMLSSLLSVGYLLPVVYQAFFRASAHPPKGKTIIKEAPGMCVTALSLTALGCIALFLFPNPLYRLASMIVGSPG